MLHATIYNTSKGLNIITIYMIDNHGLKIGVNYQNGQLCLPTKQNFTPHHRAESEIVKTTRNTKR